MRLSCQTITWGGVVGHPVGVTSIKDLFYLANGSTEEAVRDIAAAGYSGVEIFDGNLRQYEDRPARPLDACSTTRALPARRGLHTAPNLVIAISSTTSSGGSRRRAALAATFSELRTWSSARGARRCSGHDRRGLRPPRRGTDRRCHRRTLRPRRTATTHTSRRSWKDLRRSTGSRRSA
jgi:inosose dehydratase